jgi:hypothetical protein
MTKDDAISIADSVWRILKTDEFENLSLIELEKFLMLVETFHTRILTRIGDKDLYDKLDRDCILMKFFIIAEQNYQATGTFVKVS